VDLIVSLCHNYHTSEDCLKEMMSKSHKAIEDFFSIKALSALECKTETLDKIDTGTGLPPLLVCVCIYLAMIMGLS
jgi:retinoblastoma-like protein 1